MKIFFHELTKLKTPKTILLTMHYVGYPINDNELMLGLSETIAFLKGLGHQVVIIGDIPRFDLSAEDCKYGASVGQVKSSCFISLSKFNIQLDTFHPVLSKIAKLYEVPYISVYEPFCSNGECSMIKNGFVLYRDNNHLNISGSRLIGQYLAAQVNSLSGQPN